MIIKKKSEVVTATLNSNSVDYKKKELRKKETLWSKTIDTYNFYEKW